MKSKISRRGLLKGSAVAAASLGVSRFTAFSYGQIIGSNSDIRVGVIGFNGRGRSHIDAYRRIKGVRLTALCDADEKVLNTTYDEITKEAPAPRRATTQATTLPTTLPAGSVAAATMPSTQEAMEEPELRAVRPDKYRDLRNLLDNKEIDAISTATPNHWHSLITVWGCQAGKDVYVEKPISHEVWEGRQSVLAARKYNRIVQAGTQSRSIRSLKEAIAWVQAGNLGKIKVARGLCYKMRDSIGKLVGEPQPPKTVDLDLWCGPSPLEKPHRQRFHYDWHWFWETGNGDIGNQGIHQMDVARWALGKSELAPSVISVGGRFGYDDDGQTPNTQFAVHDYGDCLLIFEVRGLPVHPKSPNMDKYKGQQIGVVIECENGYLTDRADAEGMVAFDSTGTEVKRFSLKSESGGNKVETSHFANFIDAVRSRSVAMLHADIEQGHVSSALCHVSNISYRLGEKGDPEAIKAAMKDSPAATETFERFAKHLAANEIDLTMDKAILGMPLKIDAKAERFVDSEKANAMLKRNYRAPFVVPEMA